MTAGAVAAPRIGWRRPLIPPHLRRRVLAAALAAIAVVLVLAAIHRPVGTVAITVATRDLAAGTRLAAGDVRLLSVPSAAAPADARTSVSGVVGHVLADPVRAREPLTDLRLGAGQVLAGLPPGQVAAPIRLVDPGVTALLHPGIRVDVLAAPQSPDGAAAESSASARVVAADVRVLAVPGSSADASSTGETQGTLVVVAVSRADAQALAGAEAGGRLSVTLVPGD